MRLIYFFVFSACLTLVGCQQESPTLTPEYRKLTSAVYASGSVEPVGAYQVFAPSAGILQGKLINEGNLVDEGELLFIISQEAANLQLASAKKQLATAQRNSASNSAILKEAQLRVEQAKEKSLQDSADYQRQKNLIEKNATSRRKVELARLVYISSKSAWLSAKVNLVRTRESLRDQLQEASIQYQLAAEQQGNKLVKSRLDGKVYQTYIREGEMVSPNQPLAVLGHADQFYLELIVDERDIAKVKPGMRVIFSSDVMADSILEAEVSKIYPYMNQQDRSFRVDATISGEAPPLFDGASVEANIIVEEKERALVIPRSVLVGEDSVLVERDDETMAVKITTGIENLEMVEVIRGLDENSKILIPR